MSTAAFTSLLHVSRVQVMARVQTAVLMLVIGASAVWALRYIHVYAVNVPYLDEWAVIPPKVQALYDGTLSIWDLNKQHNEHRYFFPSFIWLGLGYLSRYNSIAAAYCNWFIVCLIGYVLFIACQGVTSQKRSALVAFVPIAWFIFSPRQSENLLSAFQIHVLLSTLFIVIAVELIGRGRGVDRSLAFASICGVITSFSFANGLLVWPAGLVQMLLLRRLVLTERERISMKALAVWCLIGAGTWALYFVGYQRPPYGSYGPGLAQLRENPLSIASYFLAGLASPLAVDVYVAQAIGLLLVPLYTAALFWPYARPQLFSRATSVGFGLIVFSLLSTAALTAGRAAWGPEQALDSRYVISAAVGIVGLYLFVLERRVRMHRTTSYVPVVVALIGVGVLTALPWGEREGERWRAARGIAAYSVATYRMQSDRTLEGIGFSAESVRRSAQFFEAHGMSVFAARVDQRSLKRASGSPLLSLSSVNGQPVPQDGTVIVDSAAHDTISLVGWAVDHVAKTSAGGVFVVIDDRIHLPSLYGQERSWLVDQFGSPSYRFSGFQASFAPRMLDLGRHTVRLRVVSADRTKYYASEAFTLDVR